jgi:hypothetical protein
MRKSRVIPLVAMTHFACCYALYFVSIGIGMKSFDAPHVLTSSERILTLVGKGMLLPIAYPLLQFGRGVIAPIMTEPGHGTGVRNLVVIVCFFGPLVLNSVLWAAFFGWAYSRLAQSLERARTA